MTTLSCSAVIATMSRAADLDATVAALAAGTVLPTEVIVVDASVDYDTENVVGSLRVRYPSVPFQYLRGEPSLPRQRNIGWRAAKGDVVLFLDDDVTPAPSYLSEILAVFEDDGVGGACGVISNQPSLRFPLDFYFWLFRQVRYARRSYLQRSGLPTFLYRPRAPQSVAVLTGCGMAFRRTALVDFDHRINYFDDDDMSLTVGRRWRLIQTPAAVLEHRVAAGARPPDSGKVRRRVLEQRLLHRRHLSQNPANVACYYYSVIGSVAIACLRGRPRLAAATVGGLWDVIRTRGGRDPDDGREKHLIPQPK